MKKENRGGAREGTGPKPKKKEYSEKFKKGILKALKAIEKETKVSIYDLFAKMLYSKNIQDAARVGLFKILAEMMVVKQSELDINLHQGPTIYLPETQKVPEEYSVLMIEKKKELTH